MRNNIITMAPILAKNAVFYPNKLAVVDYDRKLKYTYKEFNELTNRIANALLKMGIKKGDKVAAMFFNSPQMLETFWACNKVGLVWVAVNFRYSTQEIIDVVSGSDSVVLFYGDEFANVVEAAKGKLENVKYYVQDADKIASGEIKYVDLVSKGSPENPNFEDIGDDDLSSFLYTGGTTGRSKGSMISHRGQFTVGPSNIIAFGADRDDVFLASAPMFHGAGMQDTAVIFMALGMTIVCTRNGNIEHLLKVIRDENCTLVFFVPTQTHLIVNVPDFGKYMQSVRIWLVAAAPFPLHLYETVKKSLPNVDMRNWYGITENISGSVLSGKDYKKLPSVGRPIMGVNMKIVDVEDYTKEKPCGESGEIIIHGVTTSTGYYKDEERTAEAFKNGWLLTGDIGRIDEEGFLYVVDRKKDMIITGGENVYATEVESIISNHPNVSQVSVIGVPHAKWGELVTAVVIKKEGKEVTEEEIIKFSRERLTAFKCPKKVVFVDKFPVSPALKVLKRDLREMLKDAGRDIK
jgi:fatty-acyl-CoA synthase